MPALLHTLLPVGVFPTVGINHELPATKRLQLLALQIAAASRGKPEALRIRRGTDNCRLLALYDTHRLVGIAGQEMQAEEHLLGFLQLRSVVALLTDGAHPVSPASHSMSVGSVSHQLSVVHTVHLVDKPEDYCLAMVDAIDDNILGGSAQVVVFSNLLHSLFVYGQQLEPLPEGACALHRLLSPGEVEELRLMLLLNGV